MAGSLNRAMIIGHLGRDPEIRTLQNGGKVANFSVATSESWTDKRTGERQERTEWHNVVIFNENLVKVVESYLRKGSKVYLDGKLQTRKWQAQDGSDRYSTEIVIQPFNGTLTILDTKAESEARQAKRDDAPKDNNPPAHNGGSYAEELEDEIPF
jgi:single-strand DNA-binding protein